MTPRGGTRHKPKDTPEQALAKCVNPALKSAVKALGGYQMAISISLATDEEGRPAGFVVATKTPRPAQVKDVIDVTAEEVPPAQAGLAKKAG